MASQGASDIRFGPTRPRGGKPVVILDPVDVRHLARRPSRTSSAIVSSDALPLLRDEHPDVYRSLDRMRVIDLRGQDRAAVDGVLDRPFTSPLPLVGGSVKRLLDVIIAIALCVAFLPLMIIACACIKITSRGPVLFRQVRTGQDGRRFEMYKLRSMSIDNDDSEHRAYVASVISGTADRHEGTFKLTGDPRITKVGRILRRFSIDEVPQLLNVLRGDMSLIGPRPPLPHEVELYDGHAWQRLRVRPGLTGLWQVSGRCDLTFEQMVELDIEYWRSWSLRRDLLILLKTPAVVLGGKGAA